MCMHQKLDCECGTNTACLFHRDDILPEAVVAGLYCPECRNRVDWDGETMIRDGGWIIAYDMEAARFYLGTMGIDKGVTPEFLFDRDYCSWYGMSPMDLEENARVHEELKQLQEENKLLYFQRLKDVRMAWFRKLKQDGWRKARTI